MQSLSLLSSLKAKFWDLVRLGLGGWEDLRTLLISALSSSATCWLSLVQAASMAVIYSKLGGCLGETAKLGPLARTYLWAGVKGLLDKLMTHLGLGSSLEDPWGSLLGVGLPSQELVLSAWEAAPFSWEAWGALCLVEHIKPYQPDLAWLLVWPAWVVDWGEMLPSPRGRWADAWKELPASREGRWAEAWEELLPSPGGRWPVAGRELLPSPGGRWAIAWDILLPSLRGRRVVAWEELLPSPEGRRAPACLPACLPVMSCSLP